VFPEAVLSVNQSPGFFGATKSLPYHTVHFGVMILINLLYVSLFNYYIIFGGYYLL
jgi:hypothetical protein